MTLRTLLTLALAGLLIQGTVIVSCGAQTMRMPCCTPSSDCGTSLAGASCCGFDVPVDRQTGADGVQAVHRLSPLQAGAVLPVPAHATTLAGFAAAGVTASPPHPPHVPLYIKFASILC